MQFVMNVLLYLNNQSERVLLQTRGPGENDHYKVQCSTKAEEADGGMMSLPNMCIPLSEHACCLRSTDSVTNHMQPQHARIIQSGTVCERTQSFHLTEPNQPPMRLFQVRGFAFVRMHLQITWAGFKSEISIAGFNRSHIIHSDVPKQMPFSRIILTEYNRINLVIFATAKSN